MHIVVSLLLLVHMHIVPILLVEKSDKGIRSEAECSISRTWNDLEFQPSFIKALTYCLPRVTLPACFTFWLYDYLAKRVWKVDGPAKKICSSWMIGQDSFLPDKEWWRNNLNYFHGYLNARPSSRACCFPIVVSSPPHFKIKSREWSSSTGTFSFSSAVAVSVSFKSWVLLNSLLSFLFTSFSVFPSCLFLDSLDSFPCFFLELLSSDPESPCRFSALLSLLSLPSLGFPRYLNWIFLFIPEK